MSQHRGNSDTAGFDGQHLIDLHTPETTLELIGYLAYDVDINLVIQKIVNLQEITLPDLALTQDLFLEEIHRTFNTLLLEERSNPEDKSSTDDSCGELSQETTPRDAKQVEQPTAKCTTQETQHTVHDDAEATTLHQLASAEASQTS